MVPAEDQAIVLPWASVIVIIVLLNDAFTWATPEAMFLRSRRRTRPVASLAIVLDPLAPRLRHPRRCDLFCPYPSLGYFFLPAIGLAGPLRVRALVWVRCPRTGRPRR